MAKKYCLVAVLTLAVGFLPVSRAVSATAADVDRLVALLSNPDPKIRLQAAGDLASVGPGAQGTALRLVDALQAESDPEVVQKILEAIGGIGAGSPQVIQDLQKVLATTAEKARWKAASLALVRLTSPGLQSAVQAAWDPDETIRNLGSRLVAAHIGDGQGVASQAAEQALDIAVEAVHGQKPDPKKLRDEMEKLAAEKALGFLGKILGVSLSPAEIRTMKEAYLHGTIAGIYAAKSDWTSALTHYRRALDLYPKGWALLNNMGLVLEIQGKFTEARDVYLKSVALNGKDARSQLNLGRSLEELTTFDQAETHYRQAVALDPQFFEAQQNLGRFLGSQGRFADASPVLEAALKLNPNSSETQQMLAAVRKQLASPVSTTP